MKNLFKALFLPVCIAPVLWAGEGWETNMDAAKKKAAEEKKGLLIEFTGSDWCGPCKALKKNVLSKEEFLNAAQKDFVLVELDFPSKPLSPEQTAHNKKYGEEYMVKGYPTVVFTDAQGRPVHAFVGGRGMQDVLKEIELARSNNELIAKYRADLQKAQGDDAYRIIGDMLEISPQEYVDRFYADLKDQLKADAKDVSGYHKTAKLREQNGQLAAFWDKLRKDRQTGPEEKMAKLGEYLNTEGLLPETKQNVLKEQAYLLYSLAKIDDSIAKLGEAVDVCPDSPQAKDLKERKDYLASNKDHLMLLHAQNIKRREFQQSLNEEVKGDLPRYVDALEGYIKNNELLPEVKQGILYEIAMALIADGKMEDGLKKIQDAIDIDPKTPEGMGEYLSGMKGTIEQNKEAFADFIKKTRKQPNGNVSQ